MPDHFLSILLFIDVVAGIDGNREPEYIEEMINKQKPLVQVLRLLCLMSLAQGGVKQKLFDHFEREIVQVKKKKPGKINLQLNPFYIKAYGYEHIETLHRLEKLGLWMKRTNSAASRSTFAQCRRMLRLIVDDVDELHPNDISYVYSGYAPLSIRLVQCAMQKLGQGSLQSTANGNPGSAASLFSYVGASTANLIRDEKPITNGHTNNINGGGWRGSEDILKLLPGQAFDIKQIVQYGAETNAAIARAKRHGLQHGKTTIIFFLGGCTHTEVSAVRFLAQHDEGNYKEKTG